MIWGCCASLDLVTSCCWCLYCFFFPIGVLACFCVCFPVVHLAREALYIAEGQVTTLGSQMAVMNQNLRQMEMQLPLG